MHRTVYKLLLNGDKFMKELHLKQPGFTDGDCGQFTKLRERIQKFRERGNLKHLYRNEIDRVALLMICAYCDNKDLVAKTTISDKVLKERAYEIARNPKYNEHQRVLPSMFYRSFNKKTGSGVSVNEGIAEELHKPVIKNSKKKSLCEISKQ